MLTARKLVAAITVILALALATPANAAPPVTARWSSTVGIASEVSGPALGDGRVYVGFTAPDGSGGVRALDVATGATLWTRLVPAPVTVAPVFVPSATRLYVATSERLYALNPANGTTIVGRALNTFEDIYSLRAADGRVYVQTLHDILAFSPAMVPLWDYLLDDDPSVINTPGDGFVYFNDEDPQGNGFPQCMEKVSGATGLQVARNCAIDDFIAPTSVPAAKAVVGVGSAGVFSFRTSNLSIRWQSTRDFGVASSATSNFGGRVAVIAPEVVTMLALSNGDRLCKKSYDERSFGFRPPVFDPVTGGVYVFDTANNDLYKVGPDCLEDWRYQAGAPLAGVVASKSNVVGAAGTTVFALVP